MFVFLDIGFTLIGGPNIGPAGRLIQELNLPISSKSTLNDLLFGSPLSTPEAVAAVINKQYAVDRQRVLHQVTNLWEKQLQEAYILPGALEALQCLTESGIKFGFISNIWAPFLQAFSNLIPEEYRSGPTFASCERGVRKPDAKLYQMALNETGTDAKQAIMIGDTYDMDIAPAVVLGMKTVWILHRPEKERTDLVHILNGSQPRPNLTLASIETLHPEQLKQLYQS